VTATNGRLFAVPNLLGVVEPERVLPAHTIEIARGLTHYVVENAKPARALLQALTPKLPIREIAIVELGPDPDRARCDELLLPARNGVDIGLLSDAGCPGIADPGALLIEQRVESPCQRYHLRVCGRRPALDGRPTPADVDQPDRHVQFPPQPHPEEIGHG